MGGSSPRDRSSFFDPPPIEHSRSQSQPLVTLLSVPPRPSKSPPITTTTHRKRARAPSDPFLDTPAVSASYSSNTSAQLSTSVSSTIDDPPHAYHTTERGARPVCSSHLNGTRTTRRRGLSPHLGCSRPFRPRVFVVAQSIPYVRRETPITTLASVKKFSTSSRRGRSSGRVFRMQAHQSRNRDHVARIQTANAWI